jgi:hypothetical protein
MATLTTRERDRRGTQYVIGTVAVTALIASFVLHRQLLSAHPSAFWLPTVAGLAYGSLLWGFGSRRNSKWLANLTPAGWLIIFWALLATKLVSAPAWFISVMVGALAVTALFPKKPAPSSVKKVAIEDVRPWSGSEVAATPTTHDTGRRTAAAVTLSAASGAPVFRLSELAGFLDREIATAESVEGPLTFLTRAGVAAPDSIVGEATAGLPDGTLVLLTVAGEDTHPSAVFTVSDAASFERWVRSLPED